MPIRFVSGSAFLRKPKFLDEREIALALDHERTRQFLHGLHLISERGT